MMQSALATCMLIAWSVMPVAAQPKGPIDWSDGGRYRAQVVHPATTVKAEDLERARQNAAQHEWARKYVADLAKSADAIAAEITPQLLETMIEVTTPGTAGPCPACRAKGLPWHPNGQWSWSPASPDQLTCSVCKTIFPSTDFPEDIVLQSRFDPRQQFGFIGGDTFVCFGYRTERPGISGITRGRKVSYITGRLQTLATAYALTQEPRYARAAKAILLRFAEVFPKYLVRAGYGYGEIADMAPHVAAERIDDLPEDELVYPPNKPDRKLYTGYWSASRIGSSGMDGSWVCAVTEAYDLTCTATENGVPVYSDEERLRIERDVLLEGSYLAACDAGINNKSVGNRAGAMMVGLCVGHPGLVHFGIEGFRRAVDDWFLPDGGTSESPAYAMMTMSGVRTFGLALRGYSDPPGYAGPDGQRLDHFNACRDTRYGDCWQSLIWTLQGDLRHPPSADSYRTTSIGASFAELIERLYPSDEHLALLSEVAGGDASPRSPREAIFYREPDLAAGEGRLSLPDVVFPYLAQGYLRRGEGGRQGLVMLNASNWGGHHHIDSLDLYLWQDGRELLSDLGYLWDHPDSYQTRRSLSHNLVLVDGADQVTRARGGSFHLFSVTPRVKVMEASSRAYAQASGYRRTAVQVDHGEAGAYVLDIFRVTGGKVREYVFHGPTKTYTTDGLTLGTPAEDATPPLKDAERGDGGAPWRVTWEFEDGYQFAAWSPGEAGERVLIGEGWGQRDHRNTDRGATLPYVIRRQEGPDGASVFVSVFCGAPKGQELVKGVALLPGVPGGAVAVAVTTGEGTDLIVSSISPQVLTVQTPLGHVETDARLAAVVNAGAKTDLVLVGGTLLRIGADSLTCERAAWSGEVTSAQSGVGSSYFVTSGELPEGAALVGQVMFVTGEDGIRRAYPIRAARRADGVTRVYTKTGNVGFEARGDGQWEVPATFGWTGGTAGPE